MTHFPPYKFDPHDLTLWRGASEVPLTPKAAALLGCLLAARGARVSKNEILAAVWPDTHVQPANIKVLVREIRHALGDSPLAPTYIRSIARGGYAFVAPIAARAALPSSGVPPPARAHVLVARDREIATLNAMLQAPSSASPRLALITGDHGGGKTSLCEGFLRAIRASGGARACYAQCSERELPQEPFYPILDTLLRLDRQHPGLVPGVLAEHAPSWLALFPQWSGTTVRSEADAHLARLDELTTAMATLATDVPLAIIVDDLQWADGDTLRALSQLGAAGAHSRVMVVATCNEGLWSAGADARERFAAAAPGMVTIPLAQFSRQQTGKYVMARFGPGPLEALAKVVHIATGGNPLMVVAAFDRLLERQMIAQGPTGWRRESSVEAISRALPETLADVVARQLERLESHEREAIEAAAAVGFEFSLGAVGVALRWELRQVSDVLRPLARRGQLIVAANAHSGTYTAADLYRFRHPFYVGVIARRAPLLRQREFSVRVSGLRELPRRVAT
jgi:DNA-binding winged helix-turn-helix (wHTH) protein